MMNEANKATTTRSPIGKVPAALLVLLLIAVACLPPAATDEASPGGERAPALRPDLISQPAFQGEHGPSSKELAKLVIGNTGFAVDLYAELSAQQGNLFFSPCSISQALVMAYAGAGGETANQMADVLHITLPAERLHSAFAVLGAALSQEGEPSGQEEDPEAGPESKTTAFQLSIANSVWAQESYPFLSPFLETLDRYYGAGLRLADFARGFEQARKAINRWVSDETAGRVEDLLDPGSLDDTTRLVLVNAIYFKASWLRGFLPQLTGPGRFTRLDGSTVMVPMMSGKQVVGYGSGAGYQAVELVYEGQRASMIILMPDLGTFGAFEDSLSPRRLEDVLDDLRPREMVLAMPKFRIEPPTIALDGVLKAMGMIDAFSSTAANFAGMVDPADDRLFIDNVYHKAFVEVDEQGTEAAAATAVVTAKAVSLRPEPEPVTVDRPFVFLIRDLESGTILFMGRVLDPS